MDRERLVIPILSWSHHIDISIYARLGRRARLAQGFTDALRHGLGDRSENRAGAGATISGGGEEAEEVATTG